MKKTLKLMVMLLCVAAFATLSSCSKDNEDLIVGKWKIVYNSSNNTGTGYVWEFKSNGKMTTDDPRELIYGTEVEYTVNDDILTLAGMMSFSIDKLTNSELELTSKSMGNYHLKFNKI